jgi:putative zinc finger protein
MSTTWHVPANQLDDYQSGRLDPARVMSVEAHLSGCGACRAALPADDPWRSRHWQQLVSAVARPRLTLIERVLRRCGLPEHLVRLLAATPTLSRAWLTAVTAVLCFAVVFSYASHSAVSEPARLLPFLLVAPVLPLAGIAFAYGPLVDPAYEVLAAAPIAGARLLLVRATAVLVAALVPAGLATPLLPGPPLLGAAWLLPALSLTAGGLALATRLPALFATGGLAAGWVVSVLLLDALTGGRLLAFHPAAQPVYAGAAALLIVVVYMRRRHFDPGERRWNPPSAFAR